MIDKLHYVYVLIDPSDRQPFYVGKGTGKRAEAHLRDHSESEKVARIRAITARSETTLNQVLVRVVGRYATEKEAFAVEATLIKWVYGFNALTNLVHGHGSSTIRGKNDLSELAGIDIERPKREFPMLFTSDAIKNNETHGIEPILNSIKVCVEVSFPHLKVSEADMTQPKDPCVYVNLDTFMRIQLLVRPRKNGAVPNVIFNIRPSSRKKEISEEFEKRASEYGYQAKGNKTDRYFKIPPLLKASSDDNQDVLDCLEGIIKRLRSKLPNQAQS